MIRPGASWTRLTIGFFILALGLLTLWGPDTMVEAHRRLWFVQCPHWFWGGSQVVIACGQLWQEARRGARYRRSATYCMAAVCLTWASASLYPAVLGRAWDIVDVVAWVMIATITVVAGRRTGRRRT